LPFEVGEVAFTCDGKPLLDPVERTVAKALFFYGGGQGTFEMEVDEHDTPVRLNITWSSPAGPESPVVGTYLSQIFSNRYILVTKRVDGSVTRIRHDPDPTLTRLIPANYADGPGRIMPLTVFRQQTSTNGRPDGTD